MNVSESFATESFGMDIEKANLRRVLEQQVEDFLAQGGCVQIVPNILDEHGGMKPVRLE
ncbi:MAG: hypothetical protein KAG53_07845 [Endozoicomonadaceae bacterium]|nr:hypothetical protein [Endozoicomonadaceae bacterium]